VVRIAQAQLHAGKGLVTLNPLHSDRLLLCPVGLGGLLTALLLVLDPSAGLQGGHHFLLYGLAAAMNPRFLSAVDEVRRRRDGGGARDGRAGGG
jgi:26S proteasome regulatory subunit N1